jgi:hypothetical protein
VQDCPTPGISSSWVTCAKYELVVASILVVMSAVAASMRCAILAQIRP